MGPVMAEELFRVNLFEGRNFDNWRFRLETVLDEHGLLYLVKEDVSVLVVQEANAAKVEALERMIRRQNL